MRKIAKVKTRAIPREAYLEHIDPETLNNETLTAFNDLALMLLNTRGGQKPVTTAIKPAIEVLTKSYPSFTVPATVLRLAYVSSFIDVVWEKSIEFGTNPRNFEIMGLLPGIYYATTASNGPDLMNLAKRTVTQHLGEIHMCFNVGEQGGFEYDQCRDLMLKDANQLITAAQEDAPDIAPKLAATLASLKRATLKTPTMAIIQTKDRIKLSYDDLIGILDLQTTIEGQFIPKEQFKTYLPKMKKYYKEQESPDIPAGFNLQQLKNKEVMMIGVPPRGWSTDRFQGLLRPLNVNMVTQQSYNTRYGFYDPTTAPPDKMEEAKRANIKLIPYQTAISMAAQQLSGPEPVKMKMPTQPVPVVQPKKKKKPFRSPGSGNFLWPSSWRD